VRFRSTNSMPFLNFCRLTYVSLFRHGGLSVSS
jgi:hypothetical protein